MTVASGQFPYNYGFPTPVRATENLGISGSMLEAAMFVYAAELRKWGIVQTNLLEHECYTHPNDAPISFEPNADGSNLEGCLIVPNNIEKMRQSLNTFLFDQYSDDSVYGEVDFEESWLTTAYPDSVSGAVCVQQTHPVIETFAFVGANFLRPPLTIISGGDDITDTDLHWLAGSGIFLDIDIGEVVFNPFPFPGKDDKAKLGGENVTFAFGPVFPLVQTTLGAIPSVLASRYREQVEPGTLKETLNFEALESGVVQIDGYGLIENTTFELVEGNDNNFMGTLDGTTDYTFESQGLRALKDGNAENDSTARIYATPTAQTSGLYRLITYNKKADVPDTTIPSGFVSIWPQGDVRTAKPNGQQIKTNRIHGQQFEVTSLGNTRITNTAAQGIHVMDDAIWVATYNDFEGSGTNNSQGLTAISPYNGAGVWYRPAELELSSSEPDGPGGTGEQAYFGAHHGLFQIGNNVIRLAKAVDETITGSFPSPIVSTNTINWQLFNRTTLNHSEQSETFTFTNTDASAITRDLHGVLSNGTDIYAFRDFGPLIKFTTGLAFDGVFASASTAHGGIAGRRHASTGGEFLYTITDAVGITDPMLTSSIGGTVASGIGKYTITGTPGSVTTDLGEYTHNSAKRLRAEDHFGHQSALDTVIHSIFAVTGSSHIPNGIWMIIQFFEDVYLCRIEEEATEWRVVESVQLDKVATTPFVSLNSPNMPIEAIQLDID